MPIYSYIGVTTKFTMALRMALAVAPIFAAMELLPKIRQYIPKLYMTNTVFVRDWDSSTTPIRNDDSVFLNSVLNNSNVLSAARDFGSSM